MDLKTKLKKTFTLNHVLSVLIAAIIFGNGIFIGWVIPEKTPSYSLPQKTFYLERNFGELFGHIEIKGTSNEKIAMNDLMYIIQSLGYIEKNNTFYCILNETVTEKLEIISVQLYADSGYLIQYLDSNVFHSSVVLYEIFENYFIAEVTFWKMVKTK